MIKQTLIALFSLASLAYSGEGVDIRTEDAVGKILVKKGPFSHPYNCSAFLFKTPSNEILMGTAHHCFPYGSKSKKRKAFAHDERIKKIKSKYIKYRIEDKQDYYNRDLSIVKPLAHKNLKIFEFAKELPKYGDKLFVAGYAAQGGHEKLKLECIYLGKGNYNLGDRKRILGDYMSCDTDRSSIAGMSGGPIFNENGKLLGILSAQLLNPEDSSIRLPVLMYQKISADNFKNGQVNLDNSGEYTFETFISEIESATNYKLEESAITIKVEKGLVQ
jgi:hypothetical protein